MSGCRISFLCLFLLLFARPASAADLPGPATWDVRALERLFRIVKTTHEAGTKQVCWTLQTREGMRTSDFVRSLDGENRLTAVFLGEEDRELAVIELRAADYKGVPRDRVMRGGTTLELKLDLPAALARAKKVVLRRGRAE